MGARDPASVGPLIVYAADVYLLFEKNTLSKADSDGFTTEVHSHS